MFHKALWQRNYKQGKVAIWLLWAISLYNLPITYINDVNEVTMIMEEFQGRTLFIFDYATTLLPLGGLTIILACLLIGGERSNQGMDVIFTMPFKRKDIFLSKWLIGAVNITAITLVNMILMYIIQKTTIHGEFQTFTPFVNFFLLMFVALLAVFSVGLFIGTITGKFVSQALLTIIFSFLPGGLHSLVINAIGWHIDRFTLYDHELYWKIESFFWDISLYSVNSHTIWYDSLNKVVVGDNQPSLTTYIASLVYLIISFLLGLYLFKRTPGENNGKIILYKKLEPIFLWAVIICFAFLGGELGGSLLWNAPLIGFYIGLVVSGYFCYKILSRLMKKPLRFRKA